MVEADREKGGVSRKRNTNYIFCEVIIEYVKVAEVVQTMEELQRTCCRSVQSL